MNHTPMTTLRQQRAQALVPTVRRVSGGFRVSSASRDTDYLVTRPNGRPLCTCTDFQRHAEEPQFRCKHIEAVGLAHREGRLLDTDHGALPPEGNGTEPSSGLSVVHRYLPNEDPVRVKLIKNTKGYAWEIAVAERDPDTALSVLQALEQRVKAEYGPPEEA